MFQLVTDRTLIRIDGDSRRFLHVALEAPCADGTRERPALDLALVLDRSGSMRGRKWARACDAAVQAAQRLSDDDRLALVVYDDQVDTLMELTPASQHLPTEVEQALSAVSPRRSTNLSDGWLTGCALIEDAPDHRLSRCFLLTDGLANEGITDADELAQHAAELYARGIITSPFGVGDDYDEALLGAIADAGGGHLYDIERAEQIERVLTRELNDVLDVVWRDTWLILCADDWVQIEPLGVMRGTDSADGFCVRVGDLVSEQIRDVLFALTFRDGLSQEHCTLTVTLEVDGDRLASDEQSWIWADHPQNDDQPRERRVDRLVATYYANLARREAAMDNREGEVERAEERVRAVAQRIYDYAGEDAVLLSLAETLEEEAEEYREQLSSREIKEIYFSSCCGIRDRELTGERRRRDYSHI